MTGVAQAARQTAGLLEAYVAEAREAGLCRQTVEQLLRARVVLTPRQLRMCAAAQECDSDGGPIEVGVGGARGGGKSHWLLAQMAVLDAQRVPGYKGLLLRKVGKSAIESMTDLARTVLRATPHSLNARGVLKFPNGSRIVTGHFATPRDIDAYLGLEYDGIGVEEATTLPWDSYDSIKTCCRTSKDGWRPRIYNSTNPGGIGHGWYRRRFVLPFQRRKEEATRFVPSRVTDNPNVNRGYQQALATLTGWKRRAWLEGDWDIVAGAFFDSFSQDRHVVKLVVAGQAAGRLRIPPEAADVVPLGWRCSMDYGFSHYTVFTLACRCSDGVWLVVDQLGVRRTLVPEAASRLLDMLERYGVDQRSLDGGGVVAGQDVFAKGTDRGGHTIAKQYEDHGVHLVPAVMDRVQGWSQLTAMLGSEEHGIRATLRIHERCARLVESIPEMQHDPDHPEDMLKVDADEDGNGGDDWVDSLRYCFASRPAASGTVKVRGL